jgi:glycine amidinotransferase
VLSIDESTVMVNDACKTLIHTLEERGFTVVPVRHRHRRLFGGGFHCFTLDTVRTGGAEDYLG